ncbi:copper homeostasis protein CutC [Microbacterium barkeri]|uniref:PF03932 family protein CutC n=1 Tax=Microbacterium barkeri TaxID=33917 RepID=A0A9W6LXT6_9MICO|nr:copper homeostasis protein CutC [Microbacterium barkeri]MDR6876850.1 copper homeostasis protein [Microbacterium barkeri]GLJ62831.1 copper homeostasis protein CutC [Microbacterium barkeri]
MTAFELAVQDAAGVTVAAHVRADRIELATALALGGLTPSAGLIELAVASGIPVHVLVRPRAGGFAYDADDRALMTADVRAAIRAGAAGVVVGGLVQGRVDADLVRAARDAAEGREVTFHRAFDALGDRARAVDELAELGVTRVLTSGGASRAADALDELRALVRRADGAIQIMAGGGVDAGNAADVAATGVDAVHASAKRAVVDAVPVALGSGAGAGAVAYETADESAALAIRSALGRV